MNINNLMIATWFVGWLPLSVLAQVQQAELDPNRLHWSTWVWLTIFSLLGWIASDLPKLANWVDLSLNNGNILKTRFEIAQAIIASWLCGVLIYFVGKTYPEWFQLKSNPPEMILFVLVGIAGFAGTRGLEWARNRFLKPAP